MTPIMQRKDWNLVETNFVAWVRDYSSLKIVSLSDELLKYHKTLISGKKKLLYSEQIEKLEE